MESPEPFQRRRLVPVWAIVVPAAVFLLGVAVAVFLVLGRQGSLVSVPNVTNLDVNVARTRLAEAGLTLKAGDKRFSQSVPVNGVIDQSPAPGVQVDRGTAVTVIVSAGSESFPMPDVSGVELSNARQALEAKGLVVQTEVVPSSRPKNTVVSSTPAAGVTVSSSDVVKLAVSSGATGTALLQPADLTGRTFVIDPAPVSAGTTDVPMEVQRRLNSLLEASGARVEVTRSISDTAAALAPEFRGQRARLASATAVIGLALRPSGAGVSLESAASGSVPSGVYLASAQLAQALTQSFAPLQKDVRSVEVSDTVLQASAAPGVRIVLGSFADPSDTQHLTDPAWQDRLAADIYSSLAGIYGRK